MRIAVQSKPAAKPRRQSSPRLRRSIYLLHLWAGLGSGPIVFIVSLTACMLAFGAGAVSASLPVTGLLLWLGRRRRPAEVQPEEASESLVTT